MNRETAQVLLFNLYREDEKWPLELLHFIAKSGTDISCGLGNYLVTQ